MEYILWSTRSAGWFTSSGQYSSEQKNAQQFTYDKALDMCKVHYRNGLSEFGLIPVNISMLRAIALRP